ncbi:hypothetical protein MKX34_12970 [Paenibacillus sp. FSL R5-0636]|uniref:hypothetical protein n=1 Tax=Paenibacillus TaxID=44249 RepID=UPI00096CA1CC|nr:hypothetical protein [Paenibacillus odorifer]OMC94511.1 hypothetical protein BJP49_15915 [Paenibacillus odorifer]OMC99840.1 hypothetical protein BJP46_21560 [Paenibacillus odorifer]OZQ75608.1 hypothetical protein CA596_12455 [Paenibacillus odorifer]
MKKKTRKFLIRKYAVTLLLATLCLLYIYLLDWLYGYGLGNIGYILNYLLYTASEKATVCILLLCLFIPDIYYWKTGHQPERGGER